MSMVTRGEYFVSRSFDQMALIIGGKLPAKSDFPRRTVASREDYSELLNLTAQDLADAANYRPQGPSFLYTPG
jgi:hypothetical protein